MSLWHRLFGRRDNVDVGERLARPVLEALARNAPEKALERAEEALLEAPTEELVLRAASSALVASGRSRAAELCARAADSPHDPQRLFELGSHLLSTEAPRVAAGILEQALCLAPFDAVVRSEMALSLARSGRPREVVETLALHPNLGSDPGALFEFAWASLLTGDVEAPRDAHGELTHLGAGPLLRKLDYGLRRAAIPMDATPPDARDFLFLEHGSLLIARAPGDGGRHGHITLDRETIGGILASGAAVIRELLPRPRRVMAVDTDSQPLAADLAAQVDGELTPLGEGRVPAGILVALRGADLGDLDARNHAPPGEVTTFALTLDYSRGTARVPDMVGLLARRVDYAHDALIDPDARDAQVEPSVVPYVIARREHLPPAGHRLATAYVPDAPLPWP